MTIKTVYRILTELGQKMIIKNHMLIEDNGYYQAYKMLTKESRVWEYGLFRFEMQKHPHFEVEKNFETEDEAAKYFLMKKLRYMYIIDKYPRFDHENQDVMGNTLELNINKLINTMQKAGIPSTYFAEGEAIAGDHNSVHIIEKKGKTYTCFFLRNGKKTKKIVSFQDLWEATFFTLKRIYCYYMYDTEIAPLLEKHGVLDEITDDDFLVYIW